jgi:sec-independent protein translocase protein TatA
LYVHAVFFQWSFNTHLSGRRSGSKGELEAYLFGLTNLFGWSRERASVAPPAWKFDHQLSEFIPESPGALRGVVAMFGISSTELLIVLGLVLVLFGGSRIPSLARSLGQSITEFKKGVKGIDEEVEVQDKKSES